MVHELGRTSALGLGLAVAVGLLPPAVARGDGGRGKPAVAIVGVVVIDGTGQPPLPDMTVVVRDGRVVSVGQLAATRIPRGATVIRATGLYLIPGLWDMHTHLAGGPVVRDSTIAANADYFFPRLLAHGVTGVRDMGGDFATLAAWRTRIRAGDLLGPEIVGTGARITDLQPMPDGRSIGTAADLEAEVSLLAAQGVDFIKVVWLDYPLYLALPRIAAAHGLKVVGHVPATVALGEAVDSGLAGVEHLAPVLAACSRVSDRILTMARESGSWWDRLLVRLRLRDPERSGLERLRLATETQDERRCEPVLRELRRHGVPVTPTLSMSELTAPRGTSLGKARLAAERRVVGWMWEAGVPLLAGSDIGGPVREAGESLIRELCLLVRAGLTPMDAIVTATSRATAFLGLADSVGTIRPGQRADLVLLSRDPLKDPVNLLSVQAVMVRGRLVAGEDFEALRQRAGLLSREHEATERINAPIGARAPGD